MGSQLQTSGEMKLATGLLLAGTLVVAYNVAEAKAKPQTVRANVHVSIGGRTDTTGKCIGINMNCRPTGQPCCPGLKCRCHLGRCLCTRRAGFDPEKILEGGRQCGKDGDECDSGKACCSGLVCDGLTCGPAKKEESCAIKHEECGKIKACCNGLMCQTTKDALGSIKNRCTAVTLNG